MFNSIYLQLIVGLVALYFWTVVYINRNVFRLQSERGYSCKKTLVAMHFSKCLMFCVLFVSTDGKSKFTLYEPCHHQTKVHIAQTRKSIGYIIFRKWMI